MVLTQSGNTLSLYYLKGIFKKVKLQFDVLVDSMKVFEFEVECIKVCNRSPNYLMGECFDMEFTYLKSSIYQVMRLYTACYIELHL
jgi:hypothetical protein